MELQIYLSFTIILILNLSFIFMSQWWRKFQLYTLNIEKKWAKNIPVYKKFVDREIAFANGKYGLWLFRGMGIAWLLYTLILLVSILKEM